MKNKNRFQWREPLLIWTHLPRIRTELLFRFDGFNCQSSSCLHFSRFLLLFDYKAAFISFHFISLHQSAMHGMARSARTNFTTTEEKPSEKCLKKKRYNFKWSERRLASNAKDSARAQERALFVINIARQHQPQQQQQR